MMQIKSKLVLFILAIVALPLGAAAQEVTRWPDSAKQSFGVDAGLESAFIARATYAHRVDLGFAPDARLFARATLPIVTPDLGDWELDAGLRATVLRWGVLRAAVLAGPFLRNTMNVLFNATGMGVGATVLIGYEGDRWGLSVEAGYEETLVTDLHNSDLYRDTYFASAKDGWYATTGGAARVGLRGGLRVASIEIYLTAGIAATDAFHATVPPFYATLGSTYAF